MRPYLYLVLLCLLFYHPQADTLRHEYCFCQGSSENDDALWGWIQNMNYKSDRLNKTYTHDFICIPEPIRSDTNRGRCDDQHLISGLTDHFCHTFPDDTSICMQDWTYAVNGRYMERLPGWYRAGARYKEGFSKNKQTYLLTDCTEDCRRMFPKVIGVAGKCNFTWHDEVTTPLLRQDQCRVMEYKALDEP